jgi:1-acyl-sn-glycerol-3-phosphate acyltransferase
VFRYRYRREKHIKGPAILMGNHTLDIDAGLLGLSYSQAMHMVASEHVFRLGILTVLIRLIFAPIVRMKGKTEISTVRKILNVLKDGGRVCIFPEGNRSYNGVTGEITQASATLVKMAKCQLITYRIEGGYMRHPRWARTVRRGPMRGYEVGRYSAETLERMTVDEVLALIRRDLHEDAYARQAENQTLYRGKRLAESLETALYVCPQCGRMGTLQSKGDAFFCSCGLHLRCTALGELVSTTAQAAPFSTVTAWDHWQQSQTAEIVRKAADGEITADDALSLYRIQPCRKDELLETGRLTLSKSELMCGSFLFPFNDISDLAIVGINTLVFETRSGCYYEIRSKGSYSALKYRRFFLHCKRAAKGEYGAAASAVQENV